MEIKAQETQKEQTDPCLCELTKEIKEARNDPNVDPETIAKKCRGHCKANGEKFTNDCPFLRKEPNRIIVDLEEHKKDLEGYVMRPLKIKQSTYKKLAKMVSMTKNRMDEEAFLEKIINELYDNFFEEDDQEW